jgi:uncharacterized membrane protein YeiH
MIFTFHNTLELLGIIAFGLSGALSAMHKRLDIFGVLVLTFVTAIGGGTVRDLIIGSLPVAWLLDNDTIIILLASFVFALFFNKYIKRYSKFMFWLDTIGLAFFTIIAVSKGIDYHLHPMVCVALGTITGCFGGVIRDVLLNEIPYVFRKDVYASASIAGGVAFFIGMQFIDDTNLVSLISGGVIILIRICAKYLNWQVPNVYKST